MDDCWKLWFITIVKRMWEHVDNRGLLHLDAGFQVHIHLQIWIDSWWVIPDFGLVKEWINEVERC